MNGFVTLFTIGARSPRRDGDYGEVICAVIDPFTREVTHLVFEPTQRQKLGRRVLLLPVESSNDGVLRCTMNEFEQLELSLLCQPLLSWISSSFYQRFDGRRGPLV